MSYPKLDVQNTCFVPALANSSRAMTPPSVKYLYMEQHRHLPDINRLSIVTAMVMLSYSITAYVQLPERSLSLQLPGFLFVVKISIFTLVSLVVTVLAAAGSDWVISGHPEMHEQKHWYHWIIPALTATVIGVPLNSLSVSPAWWVIFGMGGLLLWAVLTAEYISVDPSDGRYWLATLVLTVVFLSLFLILAIAMRGAEFRLYVVLSGLVPAAALLAARVLYLRITGKWLLAWTGGIALILGQMAVCLFYLPLKPIQFGLLLTALLYAITSLAGNIEEGYPVNRIWLEPVIMFAVFLFFSFVL
jgi:hypothetical protein